MSNVSGKYAIVGVAETKVGKRPDASTHSLHLECIKACLDDAGIKAADVDGFITNQPLNDAHRSYAVRMAKMARMHPNYATDLALGGATIAVGRRPVAVMASRPGWPHGDVRPCAQARHSRSEPGPSDPRTATSTGKNRGDIFLLSPITPLPRSATCTSSAPPVRTSLTSRWQRASMRA